MSGIAKYRFSQDNGRYISFDTEGYIVEAKGFESLMWGSALNFEEELKGKHVDELAKMLKNNGITPWVYYNFEINVHLELLKSMLKDLKGHI